MVKLYDTTQFHPTWAEHLWKNGTVQSRPAMKGKFQFYPLKSGEYSNPVVVELEVFNFHSYAGIGYSGLVLKNEDGTYDAVSIYRPAGYHIPAVEKIHSAAKAAKWVWISTTGTGRESDPWYCYWTHPYYGDVHSKFEDLEEKMQEAKNDFFAIPDTELIKIFK